MDELDKINTDQPTLEITSSGTPQTPPDEPDEVLEGLSAIVQAIEDLCESNELCTIAVCMRRGVDACSWNGPHWRLNRMTGGCPACGSTNILSALEIRQRQEAAAEAEADAAMSTR